MRNNKRVYPSDSNNDKAPAIWLFKPWKGFKLGLVGLLVFIIGFGVSKTSFHGFGNTLIAFGWITALIGFVGHVVAIIKQVSLR